MIKLAIKGGKPEVRGKIRPFNSITRVEMRSALNAMDGNPLSGYLADKERGGRWVRLLEEQWKDTFSVKHAIACNSATSGLLAASFAVGLRSGDRFAVSPMTMSATVAAPMFTNATPVFCDVSENDFAISSGAEGVKAIFVTNLFGTPAHLASVRKWADVNGVFMIEDNAQSPFAREFHRYAGTVGHIGVWSLNVHKPIQCGEGGMITTDDDDLATLLRDFVNHGENRGGSIGLNLRMPEVCAAIAHAQLRRGPEIVQERVEQANELLTAIGAISHIRPPVRRRECVNTFYTVPFLFDEGRVRIGNGDSDINMIIASRKRFCEALRAEGVPIVEGYIEPLYRMPAFSKYASACPVAEDLQDKRLLYFENCAWTLSEDQIRQVGNAFAKVAEALCLS